MLCSDFRLFLSHLRICLSHFSSSAYLSYIFSCSYGANCKFRHVEAVDEAEEIEKDGNEATSNNEHEVVCQMYNRTRTCKYGDACIYKHICVETSTPSQRNVSKPKLKISKIQEKQKKRKANRKESNIHEATVLKIGRGDAPIREKKRKKDKNFSLDEEAYKQRKKVKGEDKSFHCYRCNIEKRNTNRYEWNTSGGVKLICNGCNGKQECVGI